LCGTLFAGLILLSWDSRTKSPVTSDATTAELAWIVDGYAAVTLATAATVLVDANILRTEAPTLVMSMRRRILEMLDGGLGMGGTSVCSELGVVQLAV